MTIWGHRVTLLEGGEVRNVQNSQRNLCPAALKENDSHGKSAQIPLNLAADDRSTITILICIPSWVEYFDITTTVTYILKQQKLSSICEGSLFLRKSTL